MKKIPRSTGHSYYALTSFGVHVGPVVQEDEGGLQPSRSAREVQRRSRHLSVPCLRSQHQHHKISDLDRERLRSPGREIGFKRGVSLQRCTGRFSVCRKSMSIAALYCQQQSHMRQAGYLPQSQERSCNNTNRCSAPGHQSPPTLAIVLAKTSEEHHSSGLVSDRRSTRCRSNCSRRISNQTLPDTQGSLPR